jgi:DNA-binding response OmpR family regulator
VLLLPRVLVVDSDEDTRAIYAQYLTLASWTVVEAADGRDGLVKALSERPDLIVVATAASPETCIETPSRRVRHLSVSPAHAQAPQSLKSSKSRHRPFMWPALR